MFILKKTLDYIPKIYNKSKKNIKKKIVVNYDNIQFIRLAVKF